MADPIDPAVAQQLQAMGLLTPETLSRLQQQPAPIVSKDLPMEPPAALAPNPPQEQQPSAAAVPSFQELPPGPERDALIMQKLRERDARIVADPNVPIEEKTQVLERQDKMEESAIANKEAQALEQERVRRAEYEQELAKVQRYNALAEKHGVALMPEPQPEQFGLLRDRRPASELDAQVAPQPTVQEVEKAAEPIRQALANGKAVQKVQQQEQQDLQQKYEQAQQKVAEEDAQIRKRSLADVFKDGSMAQKVGLAISILMGGISQGLLRSANNPVMQTLDNLLEAEFESKKYNQGQKDIARKRVLDEIKVRMDAAEASEKSEERKANIQKTKAEIAKIYGDISSRQVSEQVLKSGSSSGFSQDQLEGLDSKVRSRLVRLGDRYYPAVNAQAAKVANERAVMANEALQGLTQLEEMAGKNWYEKLTPTNRDLAAQVQQSLIGKLRLEMFGPGVLTDAEQKLARKVISNPTDLANIVMADKSRATLQSMMEKVRFGVRAQMRQAGVDVPMSQNDKNVKSILAEGRKRGKVYTPAEAIDALKRKGKWDPTEI